MPMDDPCPPVNRATLARGRLLEYLTLGWNVIEAGVAVGAGGSQNGDAASFQ